MKVRKPLKRSGKPIARRNAARRKKEFARTYHSKERVEFVKSLPCCVCGVVGYSENAHIESGGTGRKADYDKIIPLCGNRGVWGPGTLNINLGCHAYLHQYGRAPGLLKEDMATKAAETQAAWLLEESA